MPQSAIGFLLGAGVSIPSKAPSTQFLTDQLLSGDIPYYRHTDGRYYPRGDATPPAWPSGVPTLKQIGAFLEILREHVLRYYENRSDPDGCSVRTVNYEDLAYLAIQVSETIDREFDNPAVRSFVEVVAKQLRVDTGEELRLLGEETAGLITDHVVNSLLSLTPTKHHLASVVDCCAEFSAVPILCLNHDRLIEDSFKTVGVLLNDMTRDIGDGRRLLTVAASATQANLFKLHGSVDWYRWRPISAPPFDRPWAEWAGTLDSAHTQSAWRSDSRPLVLVGRFNKELSYTSTPFAELFAHARMALQGVSVVVVSGYSFGDKAINTMLIDWVYGAPKGARRLIVAHQDPTSLRAGARGAIGNNWDRWTKAGVLMTPPHHIGSLTWRDLKSAASS